MGQLVLWYRMEDLYRDLRLIEQTYRFVKKRVIGTSVQGRPIVQYRIGKGEKRIHISATHHAREWMTSWLVAQLLQYYAMMYEQGLAVDGVNVRELLDDISIDFVPVVNPDGYLLATEGWKKSNLAYEAYMRMANRNQLGEQYWLWKANIRGVDLNRQYPMNWENIRNSPDGPSMMNYKGESPFSEPEVLALKKEIEESLPLMVIAYHSAGEEIYWYHGQTGIPYTRDYHLAESIAELTGYALISPEEHIAGGFADWFVDRYQRPGFTIEIGHEPHPVDLRQSKKIWEQNKFVPLVIVKKLMSLKI